MRSVLTSWGRDPGRQANHIMDERVDIIQDLRKDALFDRFDSVGADDPTQTWSAGWVAIQRKFLAQCFTTALCASETIACKSCIRRVALGVFQEPDQFDEGLRMEVKHLYTLITLPDAISELKEAMAQVTNPITMAALLNKFPTHGRGILADAEAKLAVSAFVDDWGEKLKAVVWSTILDSHSIMPVTQTAETYIHTCMHIILYRDADVFGRCMTCANNHKADVEKLRELPSDSSFLTTASMLVDICTRFHECEDRCRSSSLEARPEQVKDFLEALDTVMKAFVGMAMMSWLEVAYRRMCALSYQHTEPIRSITRISSSGRSLPQSRIARVVKDKIWTGTCGVKALRKPYHYSVCGPYGLSSFFSLVFRLPQKPDTHAKPRFGPPFVLVNRSLASKKGDRIYESNLLLGL